MNVDVGSLTDNGPKRGKGRVGQKDKRQYHGPVLVGHQLANGHVKGQLHGLAEAIDGGAHDERCKVLGDGADDNTNQGYDVAANKEPPATKQIGQAAEDGVREGESERARNVDPGGVVARANVLVDVAQDVGGQDDEHVGADGRQTEALVVVLVTVDVLDDYILSWNSPLASPRSSGSKSSRAAGYHRGRPS